MNKNLIIKYTLLMLCIILTALPLKGNELGDSIENLKNQGELENNLEKDKAKKAVDLSKVSRPERLYNLGVELYKDENYEMAGECFSRAASSTKDLDLRFNSLYNKGNTEFKLGNFNGAVEAYEAALKEKGNNKAQFNLEVAKKKLEENNTCENCQNGEDGQEGEEEQEGQDGNQCEDCKDKNKGNQKSQGEKGQDSQDGETGQNEEGEQEEGKEGQDKQEGQESQEGDEGQDGEESQKGQESEDGEENSDSSKTSEGGETEEEADEVKEDSLAHSQGLKEEIRGDVEMEEDQQIPEAEVSQRARAMKNIKANPYMIEKILREMERREADLQGRARNEAIKQRREEMDPFNMNAQELRDWMHNRRRPQSKEQDVPDW